MKFKIKKKTDDGLSVMEIEVNADMLRQLLTEAIERAKPETNDPDFRIYREEMDCMNVAFAIMRSYPDSYLNSLPEERAKHIRFCFDREMQRLDRTVRDSRGIQMLDTKGRALDCEKWYWATTKSGDLIGCGRFLRDSTGTVDFVIGGKTHDITDIEKFDWAVCVPG